jgi:hypothetical protein
MKAWMVTSDGDEGADVVHAETRGQAKQKTSLNGDYLDFHATRYPEFDNREATQWALLQEGWNSFCHGCSQEIGYGGWWYDEDGEEHEAVKGPRETVYCSEECIADTERRQQHSCTISYRPVLDPATLEMTMIVYPLAGADQEEWEKVWSLIPLNEHGFNQLRIRRGEGTRVVHVNDQIEDAVYIGRPMPRRKIRASPFANPFKIEPGTTRSQAIKQYRERIMGQPYLMHRLPELRGKALACWCRHDGEAWTRENSCHGDVLHHLLTVLTDQQLQAWGEAE